MGGLGDFDLEREKGKGKPWCSFVDWEEVLVVL